MSKISRSFKIPIFIFVLSTLVYSCSPHIRGVLPVHPLQVTMDYLTCTETPVIQLNIEDHLFILNLDLGANCDLMLSTNALAQINNKKLIGKSNYVDIQGYQYEKNQYAILNATLDHFHRKCLIVSEEDPFFEAVGSKPFGKGSDLRAQQKATLIQGRVGSAFFRDSICFLDTSHCLFFVGNSIEDIVKTHPLDDFIEVPFEFDKGLICVQFITQKGEKTFFLDTGSNRSVLNRRSFPSNHNAVNLNQLDIGSICLGKWPFVVLNFPEKFNDFDGILGMDFFNRHEVCINFPEKKLFLKKTKLGMFRSHFNQY